MKTQAIPYQDQGTQLEGWIAYDEKAEKKPAVILCHAWRGRDKFVCQKAEEMTEWGYVGFALDLYGKGVLGTTKEQNEALMQPFLDDRNYLKKRLLTSLDIVKSQPQVDPNKIAVMGFCFGGLCALDMARSGANIKGAVSIHGLLMGFPNGKKEKIVAKVLALHGHDDPLVPPEQVAAFEKEMTEASADWQIHIYGNTMHAFTNPIANEPESGFLYSQLAAKRARQSIQNFFSEIL